MNKKDHRIFWWSGNRVRGLVWALGLLVLTLYAPPLSAAPLVSQPMRLDELSTDCLGLRVAALGPERVVVGWTVAEGPHQGVYFRQRQSLIWESVRQAAKDCGDQPRDLDLVFDAYGRLHMVWTAMNGARRALYYARMDDPAGVPQAAELAVAPMDAVSGDADFPTLRANAGGGVVLVWQESQAMRFMIRAAWLPPRRRAARFGAGLGEQSFGHGAADPFDKPSDCRLVRDFRGGQ